MKPTRSTLRLACSFLMALTLAYAPTLSAASSDEEVEQAEEVPDSGTIDDADEGEVLERAARSRFRRTRTTIARPKLQAATATGIDRTERFRPGKTGTVLTARFGRQLFTYEVLDGMAIMEGDIVLGRADEVRRKAVQMPSQVRRRGIAVDPGFFFGARWPGGVVPYTKKSGLPSNVNKWIDDAIQHWKDKTRINLRPKTSQDQDYVEFITGEGCWSSIGRKGGRQEVNIGSGCGFGATVHEIGHAVGLYHEQSRCDRDNFVEIKFENIDSVKQYNFNKHCMGASDIGAYNFGSIMHYGALAFSKNRKATIVTKVAGKSLGQRNGLSNGDVSAVHAIYPASAVTGATSPPGSVVDEISFSISSLFANATGTQISDGNYRLRCERGGKRLNVKNSCSGQNGCQVELRSSGDIFNISKSEGLGYRIKRSNKHLDVPFFSAGNNGTRPSMNRYLPVPQQDWLLFKVAPNKYVIRNVLSQKVLDARNSCTNQNGCRVQQWAAVNNDLSQVWKLEKVN